MFKQAIKISRKKINTKPENIAFILKVQISKKINKYLPAYSGEFLFNLYHLPADGIINQSVQHRISCQF